MRKGRQQSSTTAINSNTANDACGVGGNDCLNAMNRLRRQRVLIPRSRPCIAHKSTASMVRKSSAVVVMVMIKTLVMIIMMMIIAGGVVVINVDGFQVVRHCGMTRSALSTTSRISIRRRRQGGIEEDRRIATVTAETQDIIRPRSLLLRLRRHCRHRQDDYRLSMVPDDDGATTSPTASAVTTKIHDDDDDSDNVDDDRLGPRKLRVVIVGGGVGGLAVAARIASSSTSSPPGNSVDITIIEKNPQIGGRCGSFWVEAPTTITRENNNNNNNSDNDDSDHVMGWYRHERGPSLLLLPHIYKQLFEETTNGKYDASHYGLDMVQCVPAYQVVFDDGDRIEVGFPDSENDKNGGDCAYAGIATIAGNRETTSRMKMDSYERDGARKWDDYLRITQAYLDCGLANFIEERLDIMSFPNFVWEGVIRDFAKAWPLKPHSDLLDSLFESTKLQALASFQDLYVGLEPYRNNDLFGGGVLRSTAPAVFGLLAAIELHPTNKKAGVFAPIGGFQAVTDSLEKLVRGMDVNIQCNTTAVRVCENGVYTTASLQESHSEFLPADLIIVNADLPYAKESLLVKNGKDIPGQGTTTFQEKFDWDDSFSFSSGVISFHWSIADKLLDDLNTHNVFLAAESRSEAKESWKVLRYMTERNATGTSLEDSTFNFYVHRPTVCDPSAAPKGCDSLMILVPCKTLLRDEDCSKLPRNDAMKVYREQFPDEFVSATRQAVLDRLKCVHSLQDLDRHIVHEVVDTPATWAEQFHLAAGTPFALSHGFAQLSLTRPGPLSAGMSNVLYCGASTRPGNGVPLVLIGARQVAEKAIGKMNKIQSQLK